MNMGNYDMQRGAYEMNMGNNMMNSSFRGNGGFYGPFWYNSKTNLFESQQATNAI
jgi:hypothetical protein